MTNPVMRALVNPDGNPAMDVYLHWCAGKNLRAIPAPPDMIATFVLQNQALGIAKVAASVAAISKAYLARGLADPTAGGAVAAALHTLAPIDPPRSWPKEYKARFISLPYDLQRYLDGHEKQRDKEVKRAHSEAADARKQLARQSNVEGRTEHEDRQATA